MVAFSEIQNVDLLISYYGHILNAECQDDLNALRNGIESDYRAGLISLDSATDLIKLINKRPNQY